MAEIPAAMGVKQLEKFDRFEKTREKNYKYLKNSIMAISSLDIVGGNLTEERAYYCLIARVDGDKAYRDHIAAELKAKNIQTSVYYPHPVPRLAYYADKYGYSADKFKHAESISDRSIAFSIGSHLTEADLDCVVTALQEIIK